MSGGPRCRSTLLPALLDGRPVRLDPLPDPGGDIVVSSWQIVRGRVVPMVRREDTRPMFDDGAHRYRLHDCPALR